MLAIADIKNIIRGILCGCQNNKRRNFVDFLSKYNKIIRARKKSMARYLLTKSKIEDHIEKIGVDVRPVIERKLEDSHLYQFYQDLVEKYPNLFESLLKSPADMQIRKKLVFPGKGEVDVSTLVITQRGPVFIIPRKLSLFDEQTSLEDIIDIAITCIDVFRRDFPHKVICRVGHLNEYIFTLGSEISGPFLAERFTRIKIPPNGEINIRVNRPTDDYNRIIQLQPVVKKQIQPNISGTEDVKAYGLNVIVDFNNRDMSQDLNNDDIRAIIQASIQYNEDELYSFLNGISEEE